MQLNREFTVACAAAISGAILGTIEVTLAHAVWPARSTTEARLWLIAGFAGLGLVLGATFSQKLPKGGFGQAFRQYFGIDLRSLALFRVALGLLLLADLAFRCKHLVAHITDAGIVPRRALSLWYVGPEYGVHDFRRFPGRWLVDWGLPDFSGSTWYISLLFVVAAVFALMLLFGYCTRFATVISWFLLISLQSRTFLTGNGDQQLLRLIMFWSIFLPLGARWSVDSALNIKRRLAAAPAIRLDRFIRALKWPGRFLWPGGRSNQFASMATFALMLQIGFMYWFAHLEKTHAIWRVDGSALWYAMQIDMLNKPLGEWLGSFPKLCRGLTFGILWLEAVVLFLILLPWRPSLVRGLLVPVMMLVHLGFWLCLNIELFAFIGMACWLVFMPGSFWDWLATRLAEPERTMLRIYYDGSCNFCRKMALLLRTFLLLPHVRIRRGQSRPAIHERMTAEQSWIVVDSRGEQHLKFDGLLALLRASPLFWPLAKLLACSPLRSLGNRLYAFVAARRPLMGTLTGWLCFRPQSIRPFLLTHALAALCLFWIVLRNMEMTDQYHLAGWDFREWYHKKKTVTFRRENYRYDFYYLGRQFGLQQGWAMFRVPLRRDGWHVALGQLADGSHVDVRTGKSISPRPEDWERPDPIRAGYRSYRWFKVYEKFLGRKRDQNNYGRYGPYFCQYLCREWNAHHDGDRRADSVALYFVVENTVPPHRPVPHHPVRVFGCRCNE